MDKEKNNDIENNIDDILKHLKEKYENQDVPLADTETFEEDNSGEMSLDEINELLKNKYKSSTKGSSKPTKSEYAIDEDLMSEFIEEAEASELVEESIDEKEVTFDEEPLQEEKVEKEAEETEEDTEEDASESEIVEIVIPIIDAVSGAEPLALETEEDGEDFGDDGESDDFFGEESSENSFVCFADDEVNDEDIFLEEEEDEEIFVEDEYENETDFESLDEVSVENEAREVKKEEESDDLPWYTDEELSVGANNVSPAVIEEQKEDEEVEALESATIILPLDEDEINVDEDAPDEFERALDEELESEEEEKVTVEAEVEVENVVLEDLTDLDEESSTNEDEVQEMSLEEEKEEEKPAYSLFGDKKQDTQESVTDDADSVSFYKTIIAARTERELQYGYPITEPSNLADVYEGDFKASDIEPVDRAFDEISIDNIPESENVKDEEAFTKSEIPAKIGADVAEEKVEDDYYNSSELSVEDETKSGDEEFHPIIEFEQDTGDDGEVEEKELSKIVRLLKRICMFALPLLILWLEMMPILGIVPEGFLDYESFRAAYILIDAQLLIFMAALNYEKLLDGLKKILSPAANFYSVLSMTVIATFLGSILSCFCMTDDVPRLFNFISALYLLVSYVLEHFERRRRKEGTEMLEKGEGVFTIHRSQGKNSAAEKMYAGGVDPDKSIFEIAEVESESYYPAFSREKVEKNKNFSNGLIIGAITPAIIFGIIMAVVAIVFERGIYTAFNAFTFAVVATSPVSAMVAYYLPLLISHKRLSVRGCVIAGYESASELSDCDALIFNDTHLFKECDAKEAGIKLFCDESKTRELFVSLACAYAKIGGPMKNTFSSVLGSESHKVSMIRITRNGFEAVIDNKNNLIVGSAEYLGRYGIYVEGALDNKEAGVIYVALNSVLSAKISVFYRTQPLFEALLEILDEYGVRAVIETYDPMITGKYVAKARDAFLSPVSVVHKNINDYKADSKAKLPLSRFGAFATASRLKLVELICFCKSLCKIRKINNAILIGSYAFSGLLCLSFVINGAIMSANMLWVLFYQLALMGIYAFSAIKLLPLSFEGMQEKRKREEQRKQERENKERYE
ncbi:MAG: magnesium transporter [Clostridia bacterium]|nr:magnesium transporter [Clostridia bacterium]